jgi:hypothetical protein
MSRTRLLVITLLLFACNRLTEQSAAPPQSATATSAAPVTATQTAAAPVQPPTAAPTTTANIASQETNWKGVTATITEFRRRGNTLTAKVRLTNAGTEQQEPDVQYPTVYLIDTGAGKKYEVLKDEKNVYIADLLPGWNYRWYGKLNAGESHTIWMKFPAPPPEVKAITLQLPNMAPFEDVSIQD